MNNVKAKMPSLYQKLTVPITKFESYSNISNLIVIVYFLGMFTHKDNTRNSRMPQSAEPSGGNH